MSGSRRETRMSCDASIIDAIGGGLCKIHGVYYGHGKHGIKACPLCDIEAHFSKEGEDRLHLESVRETIKRSK